MPVRIRLARPPQRTKLTTHYNIVAIDGRKRRDAKPLEVLGVYDPKPRIPEEVLRRPWRVEDELPGRRKAPELEKAMMRMEKRVEWSAERISYWLSVGAQPSKTIEELLEKGGLIPAKPKPQRSPTLQLSSLARSIGEEPGAASPPSTGTGPHP
ncbi:ribosomal protein S16-domain-containing protein [Cantharellus anzutake]|uniref:ribosomal protein S16-domain-containing protein n=1 Tax=Cantharellus anzutake TaxID=1750568 RepID=UPI00190315E3|nr:ribosomal protein S16-domain-containing protein [Cantharellus anzutake]KAF8322979.1 ribosomal protein S16-domain-containing protein [Cantharellus anzutake]